MQIKNRSGKVLREVHRDSLEGADLSWADLRGAVLYTANLSEADFRGADLSGADLRGADLGCTYLRSANLRGADLRKADLSLANLRGSDLSEADLREADLTGASLSGAHIEGAILPPPIVPSEGEFTGYKKVLQADGAYTVITLRIPEDARRTSALTSRKCRASHAVVVKGAGISPTTSRGKLAYTPGTTFLPDARRG
jgi:hypothetical protein